MKIGITLRCFLAAHLPARKNFGILDRESAFSCMKLHFPKTWKMQDLSVL